MTQHSAMLRPCSQLRAQRVCDKLRSPKLICPFTLGHVVMVGAFVLRCCNGWDMLGYVGMETMLKCQVCAIGLPHYGACLPLLLEVASELSGPSPSVTGTIRHLRKRWTNRSTLDLTGCVCHTISRTGGRGREYIEASGCAKAGLEALGSGPHVTGRC